MTTRLIFIRHCEAAGNKERYFQGHINGDISDKGRLQLAALAARFADVQFDAVYSSPLTRALLTAEAALGERTMEILTDDRLMEINGGVWEGKPWAQLPSLYPQEAENWSLQPHLFHPEDGEHMREVYDRMSAAALDIAARHGGQTVVIATHGCALRNLLCWAKGWPLERLQEVDWCDNTGVNIIDITDGVPTVISENDCTHLSEDISTFASQLWWRDKDSMIYDD